jgi:hypothetical protein
VRSSKPAKRGFWVNHIWLLPVLAGTAAIAFLCWGAWISGYQPKWLSGGTGPWWRVTLQSGQEWPLLVTVALWCTGLASYWWPRRPEHQPIGLIAVGGMVLIAAALGTSSYVPCRGRITVTGVMFWVLQMYVGQPPSGIYQDTHHDVGCINGPAPLALQLGQDVGLAAILIGAASTAAVVLWKDPVQQIQSRFARNATVFTGLSERTLRLLRLLAEQAGKAEDIVVIEPDKDNTLLAAARLTGARVIIGEPADPRVLRPVIRGWRGCALHRLYALSGKVQDNDRVIAAAREILGQYKSAPDPLPHLVTLIDDPRHAESWRNQHGPTTHYWFEDALSSAESTAVTLVNHLLSGRPQHVLLCGDSTLTLVILHELARRAWERTDLATAAAKGRETGLAPDGPPPPLSVRRVTVFHPRSIETFREYDDTVPAKFIENAPGVTAVAGSWRQELLGMLDRMPPLDARNTAVIIVDPPDESSMDEAGGIARLHPEVPVFILAAPGQGTTEAIFGQLRPVERGLLVDGGPPVDSWTRVAEHWHECYRLSHPVPPGHPRAARRRPWAELDKFTQQDNIMQVQSILSAVTRLGRRWVPAKSVLPGSFVELSGQDIERVAEREHARWEGRRRAFGWSASARAVRRLSWPLGGKPDRRPDKTNSLVVPWAELSPDQREANCQLVAEQIAQLETMGFLPVLPTDGPPTAADFKRIGLVQAKQLGKPRRWTLRTGEEMRGNPGDWQVTDSEGNLRTVTDPEFHGSHELVKGRTWRRIGVHRAWQVTEDVLVRTKEGDATARPGDWVVQGPAGERWPVRDEQFRRGYLPVLQPPVPDGDE